uniref:Zinc finger homeobox protein 4 n=1 Tax=Timema genevievae TaxID=629358 RepID=A0A7R9K740_TIMGE|nr:unnamed protein product [Timema genevievae]
MQFNENHQRRQRKEREEENEAPPPPMPSSLTPQQPETQPEGVVVKIEVEDVPEQDLPEVAKSVCQHCRKEFSSVWVLKAHCEEVHRDLVPPEFLEKYAQQIKSEYEKKGANAAGAPSAPGPVIQISTSSNTDAVPEKEPEDNKEALHAKMGLSQPQQHNHHRQSTPPVRTPPAPSTPTASSTPASSTDSIPATLSTPMAVSMMGSANNVASGNPQSLSMSLAQQMNEMQAALNVMAASQLQQQLQQFNPMMMGMAGLGMGLPLGLNMNALAAMNLQPPLVPMMMPPPPFDTMSLAQAQSPLFSPQGGGMDHTSLLAKQQQHLLQQQQQAVSAAQQKRARTRITDDQLKILRAHFDINNSPSEDQIHEMAGQSGLPPKVIKHWFRNTLFKERQRNKDSPYNFNNPPSTTLNLEEYEKTGETKVMPLNSSSSSNEDQNPKEFSQRAPAATSTPSSSNKRKQSQPQSLPQPQPFPPEMIKLEPRESIPSHNLDNQEHKFNNLFMDSVHRKDVEIPEDKPQNLRQLPSPLSGMGCLPPSTPTINECNIMSTNTPLNVRTSSPNNLTLTSIIASQLGSDSITTSHPNMGMNLTAVNSSQNTSASNMLPPKLTPPNFTSPNHMPTSPNILPLTPSSRSVSPGRSYNNNSSDGFGHGVLGGGCGTGGNSNGSNSSGGSSGKRANRTRFTDYQIKVLQEFFENNAYPKDDDLEYLSKLLSLSPRVIVVWFQNARQKARKVYENQPPVEAPPGVDETDNSSKEGTFQCDKCNLVFPRFDLWREHQLVHIMNPNLFPTYPPDSPFGILQQHAQIQQQQHLAGLGVADLSMNSSTTPPHQHPLASMLSSSKRKYEDYEDVMDRDGDQPKDKRLRTTILPEQLDYLYQKYQLESNPSRKMLENIAREVGLKKRVVQVWFQNTRARERKGQFRAHAQVINKRCPFCPALFKVKSALESHLVTKHADQCTRGEINIDALPDEELSMESAPSFSSQMGDSVKVPTSFGSNNPTPNMMPPLFPPFHSADMESSLKKYYEESMKRYLNELQAHHVAQNGGIGKEGIHIPTDLSMKIKQEPSLSEVVGDRGGSVCGADGPLDLSKPVDLSRPMKVSMDHEMRSMMAEQGPLTDLSERSICYDDDSASETTEIMDGDESNPTSPASSTQSGHQRHSTSGGGSSGGGKRFRTQMSSLQVKAMKSLFSDYKTPTMAECEMLGREIGLPKRVVQVWFQNARAKEKKNKLALQKVLGGPEQPIQEGSRSPEECKLCLFKYSHKYSIQDHIFTKKHIDNVKAHIESGKAAADNSGNTSDGGSVAGEFTVPPVPGLSGVGGDVTVPPPTQSPQFNNNQQQLAQLQMLQMAGLSLPNSLSAQAMAAAASGVKVEKDAGSKSPAPGGVPGPEDMALLHQLYGLGLAGFPGAGNLFLHPAMFSAADGKIMSEEDNGSPIAFVTLRYRNHSTVSPARVQRQSAWPDNEAIQGNTLSSLLPVLRPLTPTLLQNARRTSPGGPTEGIGWPKKKEEARVGRDSLSDLARFKCGSISNTRQKLPKPEWNETVSLCEAGPFHSGLEATVLATNHRREDQLLLL